MIHQVKSWLEEGDVDVFIGYKMTGGHCLPHCFTRENVDEVEQLVTCGVRYPLEKIAVRLARTHPEAKIGLLARDCTQRAIHVLAVWNQLNPENIRVLNVNCCPSPLKRNGDCSYLNPPEAGAFKKQVGIDNASTPAQVQAYGPGQRLSRWLYEFQKCIKCYGCRDICPVCFCSDCSLDHDDLVGTGRLPPEVPIFHLVRAVHMAGRCVDCGLCEEACPVDIPLRLLYRRVNEIVKELFDYETGTSAGQPPLSVFGDRAPLSPLPMELAS